MSYRLRPGAVAQRTGTYLVQPGRRGGVARGKKVRNLYYRWRRSGATMVGMTDYADYCPISTGVDVLGDRWTPLVIRELAVGAHGFNEIHRGIPRVSRTLLAQRLRTLERLGLVQRAARTPGRSGRYTLTPAGVALSEVVWAMGHWAAEWMFSDPTEQNCDGLSLIWRMHQLANHEKLPRSRTIVHLVLTGPGGAEGWLAVDGNGMTVCKDDQGHDVDLAVEADTGQMYRWLMGMVSFRELVSSGHARLLGPSRLAREFPTWFQPSSFAAGLRRSQRRQGLQPQEVRSA
jgi:DNA-binding HxlR family transcriptional regulator